MTSLFNSKKVVTKLSGVAYYLSIGSNKICPRAKYLFVFFEAIDLHWVNTVEPL
jgi:hypothetical protein